MAAKTDWGPKEEITSAALNELGEAINQKAAKGADGKSVTSLALTVDEAGKVTGGTLTLSDNSTSKITVTQAGA